MDNKPKTAKNGDKGKKHAGGRPRKYKTVKELQKAIDAYFNDNDSPRICALALALGFNTRKSLLDYEGYGGEFLIAIKRAKCLVEDSYEAGLREKNPAGSIFALKNFDWHDKQEHEISGAISFIQALSGATGGSND